MRAATLSMVAGLRENRPPVRAKGSESTTSQASSVSLTRVTASSGPKTSSRSTGESAGRSVATVGGQNQPSPGTSVALAAIVPSRSARSA